MDEDRGIREILATIKTTLEHLGEEVADIKNTVAPVAEKLGRIEEQYKTLQRDVTTMMSFRDSTSDFVARAKGGMAVALFLFAIIQTLLGVAWSNAKDAQTKMDARIQSLENKK